ncbi:hypothetical protein WN48_02003 [Eufriesea mexicana]|nr:hypothetical protein WN48_02003 [Eufriesea mexicana]
MLNVEQCLRPLAQSMYMQQAVDQAYRVIDEYLLCTLQLQCRSGGVVSYLEFMGNLDQIEWLEAGLRIADEEEWLIV